MSCAAVAIREEFVLSAHASAFATKANLHIVAVQRAFNFGGCNTPMTAKRDYMTLSEPSAFGDQPDVRGYDASVGRLRIEYI